MITRIIATLLILSAFATVSANLASAQGTDFRRDGFNRGGGGSFHGRGSGSTDEDSTEEASVDWWTATGTMTTGTMTTVDFPTGTESLPVTIRALSSASV